MVRHESADMRRRQLRQAALAVCSRKGYHHTRMEDVVREAGLSKGALYHHFRNKEQLFMAVLEEMMQESQTELELALAQTTSVEAALRQIFEQLLVAIERQPELYCGLMDFLLLALRKREFRASLSARYEQLIAQTEAALILGVKRGEFSAAIDVRRSAQALITGQDGIALIYTALEAITEGLAVIRANVELLFAGLKTGPAARVRGGQG
jgi:AcrR family transcriptional regulator